MEIDELINVRKQLEKVMGKEFAQQSEFDDSCIHKIVAEKINLKIPEEGEKVKRMIEIAKERNIDYKPTQEAYQALIEYCDRKGMPNPMTEGGAQPPMAAMPPPMYNPMAGQPMGGMPPPMNPVMPPPMDQTGMPPPAAFQPPPPMDMPPPAGMPPGAGYPPPPIVPPE